ncbi:adenosylcobinamide-GDP ribazoletransferase [Desulfopila sp. IMCC35008]|uniref:adenosylcobinamide-GDP ribazoletransferase n=1 Tax=Desulfopila sp. IMCC35008 TaxID=2653858 RepID=UPI0013D03A54|nr:adenosylcobinamide-GDP ribazoletransferase [Desulfopila sp. IMCC35008]
MEGSGLNNEGEPEISFFIALLTAVRFLTIIPVSWKADRDEDHFGTSIIFFPLVGLIIGCLGSVLVLIANQFLPGTVVSFILLIYLAAISGFLHLDGVADSGDGLLSYRPAKQSLEIMKDSRVGAMGVIVIVFLLLGKYSALSSIPVAYLVSAALVLPVGGRLAILLTMTLFPYGRREGGLGGLFYSPMSRIGTYSGAGLLFLTAITIYGFLTALVLTGVVIGTVLLFGLFCMKRLGGVTGDTLGAVSELTEFCLAMVLCSTYLS